MKLTLKEKISKELLRFSLKKMSETCCPNCEEEKILWKSWCGDYHIDKDWYEYFELTCTNCKMILHKGSVHLSEDNGDQYHRDECEIFTEKISYLEMFRKTDPLDLGDRNIPDNPLFIKKLKTKKYQINKSKS